MRKQYSQPCIEVENFMQADVIMSSNEDNFGGTDVLFGSTSGEGIQ